jgi:Plavaka transposase
LKVVDQLPIGPEWKCELIRTNGDPIEGEDAGAGRDGHVDDEMELWMRDPVACVQELVGNPAFHGEMAYAPEKVYTDPEGQCRVYDEMWTGDWWWEMQVISSLMT